MWPLTVSSEMPRLKAMSRFAIAVCRVEQHVVLALGQCGIAKVFGDAFGNIGRDEVLAGMDSTDGGDELRGWHSLQDKAAGPAARAPLDLHVTLKRRQHHNACVRELCADLALVSGANVRVRMR